MADNLNLDVVFRLAVQNAGDAARDLEGVANQANRLGQLSDQGLDQFNRGLARGSQEARNLEGQLSTLRYANYDLSRTYLTLAAGIAAAGTAAVMAFASQESAFTEVERILATNGESVGSLRDDLMALSTEIPVSFSDLSAVAAIGAALDIASKDLAEFSEVVAQTAAVTGVSTEEVASGIARIAQYTNLDDTADGFEKISSAILAAGNISVATEPEVLRFAQAIALPGSNAGLAADEIIGFAAATASFARINVEGAGSAFARVFNNIERAVDEGGEKLDGFADIAGMSASEFRSAWDEGGAGGAFRAILQGLNQDLPNLNANLDELGIRNIRDRRVVSALAQQWD